MKNRNKGLWNGAVFALLLSATAYGVFHGQDIGALRDALARCRTDWLVCAAGCVFLFFCCEARNLRLMLDAYGMGMGRGMCFFTAAVGFFFSAITPSSSGGQPMQIYFMRKRGVPVSVTSVALLLMAIMYKLTLVLLGLALMIFGHGLLRSCLGGMLFLYYVGLGLTAGWTAFLLLLVFHPRLARGIMIWGMSVLEELHIIKGRAERQAALELSMDMYGDTAAQLRQSPRLLARVFCVSLVRRGAILSVTWCVYRALGLAGQSWGMVVLLQAVISICADMLPLPGGMGVSEGLFMKVFQPVFGSLVLPGMVLSRGIGHYCQLLLCGAFTLMAILIVNRGKRE